MSHSSTLSRLVVAATLAGLALGLSACGRKAEPELPIVGAAKAEARPVGIPIGPTAPSAPAPAPQKKSFLLDFLL